MHTLANFYIFGINMTKGAKIYESKRKIYVPNKIRFTVFEPTTLINNSKHKTAIILRFKSPVSASSLKLYIPVID